MTTIATSLERCTLITMHEPAPHTVPQADPAAEHAQGRMKQEQLAVAYRRCVTRSSRQPGWPEPEPMEGDLRIVPLTSQILDLDLAAYRASPKAISAHSAGRWPGDDLSRDEAGRLMAIHEAEHSAGTAYAYAVVMQTARANSAVSICARSRCSWNAREPGCTPRRSTRTG